jgi:hypothetical protein
MHDEMNQNAMSDEMRAAEAALDARLVRVLEDHPEFVIAEDFAARVAARVPQRKVEAIRLRRMAITPRHYGRNMIIVCVLALAIAMIGISAAGLYRAPVVEAIDWLLCAQFIALVAWLRRRWQQTHD